MMTKLLALRLADDGISVYEVRPGIIRTDMTAERRRTSTTAAIADGLSPIRRWGEPADVARAAAALVRGGLRLRHRQRRPCGRRPFHPAAVTVREYDYVIVGAGPAGVLPRGTAFRGFRCLGPAAGGRRHGPASVHPRAGRLRQADRQRPTPGAIPPHPRARSAGARCGIRRAGCWAAAAPSTPWSTSAATPRTTTPGPRRAAPAGPTPTSCLLLQAARGQRALPQRVPRLRRPARRQRPRAALADIGRIPARGAAGRDCPSTPISTVPTQEGCGYYQVTNRNARRCSGVDAFLRPAMGRRNLAVETRTMATRVAVEDGRAVKRRLSAGRQVRDGASGARGAGQRRRHRLAQAAHAVGHRPQRRAEGARYRRGSRLARSRAEPAGPRGRLRG